MSLKLWPEDERPREKMMKHGVSALSDAELLAVFLRTGTQGKNVIDLSRDLLQRFGSLEKLLSCSLADISKVKGMGVAKYTQLQAILELGKRVSFSFIKNKDVMQHHDQLSVYIKKQLMYLKQELFSCLFLNARNQIIAFEKLFFGTVNRSNVHPRTVVQRVLFHNAVHVVFAHNHPSGHAEASQSDIYLTNLLNETLGVLDVKVLDHFIVADDAIFSFSAHGLI